MCLRMSFQRRPQRNDNTDYPDLQRISSSLQRLAHIFREDELELRIQFLELLQMARVQKKNCGDDISVHQVWKETESVERDCRL